MFFVLATYNTKTVFSVIVHRHTYVNIYLCVYIYLKKRLKTFKKHLYFLERLIIQIYSIIKKNFQTHPSIYFWFISHLISGSDKLILRAIDS